MRISATALAFASLAAALPSLASALECVVDTTRENVVKFISDAPLEDFEGITRRIDGYAWWPGTDQLPATPEQLDSSECYFEVDLASIDTGIGLRNRDMREDYLHTEKHPFAHFTGVLTDIKMVNDTAFTAQSRGSLFIHGETRQVEPTIDIYLTEGLYRVQTAFSVKLPDYNIEVPSLMFLKIDENIDLELDFYMRPSTE
jgi:polyisoprenoid-binding protein YceI